MSSTITINGVTYHGNNLVISNGKVIVNGVDYTPDSKQITIEVNGNVGSISCDVCEKVNVTGDVHSVRNSSGDIEIHGNVTGPVSNMSGDIECDGQIYGSVSTMSGNIKYKK